MKFRYGTFAQLGCGPPNPAQKVLILPQKWLLCIVNEKLDINEKFNVVSVQVPSPNIQ